MILLKISQRPDISRLDADGMKAEVCSTSARSRAIRFPWRYPFSWIALEHEAKTGSLVRMVLITYSKVPSGGTPA